LKKSNCKDEDEQKVKLKNTNAVKLKGIEYSLIINNNNGHIKLLLYVKNIGRRFLSLTL